MQKQRDSKDERYEFIHPPVNYNPGSEYGPDVRNYQGIPGIERAPGGRLWAVWYAGIDHEDRFNYVVGTTSADDGQTWSDLKFVIDPDGDGPMRTSDPCLWLDPGGRLWLFWWLNGPGALATVTFAMTTDNPDDENPVWSEPRVICEGVMLNKPIVTCEGDWLLPTAIWYTDNSCRVLASTDQGESWALRGAANVPLPADRNCDEPMIVERRDGSLMMLVRTMYGIGRTVSTDGGRTWEAVEKYLPDATSRFYFRRLSSGNLLLVKHGPLDKRTGRSHLTAYLSCDDGESWQGELLLDERQEVSYPDGIQAPDGTIYIIYDWNRADDKHILMATFTEADMVAGKPTSSSARFRVLVNQSTGYNPKIWLKDGRYLGGPPYNELRRLNDGSPLLSGPAAAFEAQDGEVRFIQLNEPIFSDRPYTFNILPYTELAFPKALIGKHFIFSKMNQTAAICREPGIVYVITSTKGRNPDSLEDRLLEQGFEQASGLNEFILFVLPGQNARLDEACSVYQKYVDAGESIEFGKWGVLCF